MRDKSLPALLLEKAGSRERGLSLRLKGQSQAIDQVPIGIILGNGASLSRRRRWPLSPIVKRTETPAGHRCKSPAW